MKSESEQRYLQTQQRATELDTLFAIQQAITRCLDLEVVLQLIADEARRLTASQRSVVFLLCLRVVTNGAQICHSST